MEQKWKTKPLNFPTWIETISSKTALVENSYKSCKDLKESIFPKPIVYVAMDNNGPYGTFKKGWSQGHGE
jgi:hypothetical protein